MSLPCECLAAGFCPRHRMHKTPYLHQLCKNDRYRNAFDAGTTNSPTLGEKVVKFGAAMAGWIAAGMPMRSQERTEEIFATICSPCEHFAVTSKGAGKCKLCGCSLKQTNGLKNKISMATEACPIGKWLPD